MDLQADDDLPVAGRAITRFDIGTARTGLRELR